MKSIIISLIIMVAGLSAQAQTPSDLFQQFKGMKDAEYVHIGRLLLSVARPLVMRHADDPAARTALRCVRSLRTLDLEDCAPEVRKQFAAMANSMQVKGYHELASSHDKGERTRVLIRQKGKNISELLLLSTGEEECSLVQIKGKVSPKDIDTIVDVMK